MLSLFKLVVNRDSLKQNILVRLTSLKFLKWEMFHWMQVRWPSDQFLQSPGTTCILLTRDDRCCCAPGSIQGPLHRSDNDSKKLMPTPTRQLDICVWMTIDMPPHKWVVFPSKPFEQHWYYNTHAEHCHRHNVFVMSTKHLHVRTVLVWVIPKLGLRINTTTVVCKHHKHIRKHRKQFKLRHFTVFLCLVFNSWNRAAGGWEVIVRRNSWTSCVQLFTDNSSTTWWKRENLQHTVWKDFKDMEKSVHEGQQPTLMHDCETQEQPTDADWRSWCKEGSAVHVSMQSHCCVLQASLTRSRKLFCGQPSDSVRLVSLDTTCLLFILKLYVFCCTVKTCVSIFIDTVFKGWRVSCVCLHMLARRGIFQTIAVSKSWS